MKISITLPSIYPDSLANAINNINETTRLPHEILVVSPFEMRGDNVVWIQETERRGCNYAQVVAAKYATGDLITAHADDFHYVDGWDEKVVPDFLERERLCRGFYLMGLRYDIANWVGTVFGMYYANFPFARRELMSKLGWLGPEYKRGFGDSDLSMRVWDHGGVCEFSTDKVLVPVRGSAGTLDDMRKQHVLFEPEDMALFLMRWKQRYGIEWDTSYLRGFNLDVDIVENPQVLHKTWRTIYNNAPSFKLSANFIP